MSMYLRGRTSSRNVKFVLEFSDGSGQFESATFSASAATSGKATNTGFKTINAFYTDTPKNNLQCGFDTNGDTYFGAATDNTTNIFRNSTGVTILANNCLYGLLNYHQVPVAPTSPATSSITDQGFTLSWTAPADNGGTVINGYQIQVSTASNFATVTTFNTTATSAVLTGLQPNTAYYYRVAAKNWLTDNIPGAPMSPWLTGGSTVTTLTAPGGKRYTGTSWVDTTVAKRYNGSTWVDLTITKRYNGSTWVDLT